MFLFPSIEMKARKIGKGSRTIASFGTHEEEARTNIYLEILKNQGASKAKQYLKDLNKERAETGKKSQEYGFDKKSRSVVLKLTVWANFRIWLDYQIHLLRSGPDR